MNEESKVEPDDTQLAELQIIGQLKTSANAVCAKAHTGDKYALRTLARVSVQLTLCMDELMKSEAALECWKPIFSELPYMPILKHPQGADMKLHRKRMKQLGVGSRLNDGKFDPHTPINQFVSKCLIHLQDVRSCIDSRHRDDSETPERFLARCTKGADGTGWLHANEIPIHLAAYQLPPLAKSPNVKTGEKSLADKWAEILMQLIELNDPSLEDFARQMGWKIRGGKLKSDIHRYLAQSLETLAPSTGKASS